MNWEDSMNKIDRHLNFSERTALDCLYSLFEEFETDSGHVSSNAHRNLSELCDIFGYQSLYDELQDIDHDDHIFEEVEEGYQNESMTNEDALRILIDEIYQRRSPRNQRCICAIKLLRDNVINNEI